MFDGLFNDLFIAIIVYLIGMASMSFLNLVRIDSRLTGRWEGTLTCSNSDEFPTKNLQTHVFHCQLVLAKPTFGANHGILYYQRECTAKNEIIRRGLDEFTQYDLIKGYISPKLKLRFTRKFHTKLDGTVNLDPASIDFDCTLSGIVPFSEPKIYMQTKMFENVNSSSAWAGVISKK